MVSADWNDLKPMQNVTAKGLGGANDYSNWTYTYNESSNIARRNQRVDF